MTTFLRTFVHGLMLGPTPKPVDRSNNIRFNKYDFPVLYIPATPMTPIAPFNEFRKLIASSLITNSIKISSPTSFTSYCLSLDQAKREGLLLPYKQIQCCYALKNLNFKIFNINIKDLITV